jgi:hypothetical protein
MESISAFRLLLLQVLHQLFEYLRFVANSVFFRRAESTPSSVNHRLESVRSLNRLAFV